MAALTVSANALADPVRDADAVRAALGAMAQWSEDRLREALREATQKGDRIRIGREARQLSKTEFARRASTNWSHVHRIEHGPVWT